MAEIDFYRQARHDGGIRTAIEVAGEPVLGLFEPGTSDDDPALDWYVDVRCHGPRLPTDPARAREWLVSNGDVIRDAMESLARRIDGGVDVGSWPLEQRVAGTPRGVTVRIVTSAARRLAGVELPQVIRDVARNWGDLLNGLREMTPAAH